MAKQVIPQNGAWNQHPWLQGNSLPTKQKPVIDYKTPRVVVAGSVSEVQSTNTQSASTIDATE